MLGRYFEYIWIVSRRGLEAKLIAELAEQERRRNTQCNERSLPFYFGDRLIMCIGGDVGVIIIYNLT